MPLPLSTLVMEAIATNVIKWQTSKVHAIDAIEVIEKLIIAYRAVEEVN